MRILAYAYAYVAVAVALVGVTHACRQGRPARFAGVRLPGAPVRRALTIGSPLSAPPLMHLALLAAVHREPTDATTTERLRMLAAMFLVGIAGERDTWSTLRRPGDDPPSTACVMLDAALPAAMLRAAR